MLTSSELRVGNIVTKNGGEYVVDFTIIKMAHNYEPIPLTPEVLNNFGFKKESSSEKGWYELRTDTVCFVEGDKNGTCEVYLDTLDSVRVSFLHELQNLYYIITKQELVVKL